MSFFSSAQFIWAVVDSFTRGSPETAPSSFSLCCALIFPFEFNEGNFTVKSPPKLCLVQLLTKSDVLKKAKVVFSAVCGLKEWFDMLGKEEKRIALLHLSD